jgi:hypothetical protein
MTLPRPRAPKSHTPRPERLARDGAVLLSHNHLSLLQGLLDRPRGRARSKRDLIAAAQPYLRRYRGCPPSWWTVNLATYTLNPAWVLWRRQGNRLVYKLRPRGRAILEGTVAARVIGFGRYRPGERAFRGARLMPRVRDSDGREYFRMSLREDDERDLAFYKQLRQELRDRRLVPASKPPPRPEPKRPPWKPDGTSGLDRRSADIPGASPRAASRADRRECDDGRPPP